MPQIKRCKNPTHSIMIEMLRDLKINQARVRASEAAGREVPAELRWQIEAIEEVFSMLSDIDREMMTAVFVQGKTVLEAVYDHFCSRTEFYRRRDCFLDSLWKRLGYETVEEYQRLMGKKEPTP